MWEASGPVQELPSGAVAAPWRVSVIIRLLEDPGRFPVGDDSRIMPRNQAPLLAQVEQRHHVLKTTDAALGIIKASELCRRSCRRKSFNPYSCLMIFHKASPIRCERAEPT